jgi:hypothetical protein
MGYIVAVPVPISPVSLRSLKLSFDISRSTVYLAHLVAWINSFSAPIMEEARLVVFSKWIGGAELSVDMRFQDDGASCMQINRQHVSPRPYPTFAQRAEHVEIAIQLQFGTLGQGSGSDEDMACAAVSLLNELDLDSKRTISLAAIKSITLRLSGVYDEGLADTVVETLESVIAWRRLRGMSVGRAVLFERDVSRNI